MTRKTPIIIVVKYLIEKRPNFQTPFFPILLRFINLTSVLILVLLTMECTKNEVPLVTVNLDVAFLGHKGGGSNSYNDNYIENTLPAVKDGLRSMNGVEVDVQMSLDGTLWIYHNADIGESSCQAHYHHSIVLLRDSEIEKVQICSGAKQDRIYKLEELANYWGSTTDGFPISMHIKHDQTADTLNHPLIGGKTAYLLRVADNLKKVFPTIKHQGQLFVEVNDGAFRDKVHSTLPEIKICLLKEGSFPVQVDAAIKGRYDGLSSNFSIESMSEAEVKRAHDNGLIVHLWTPNTKVEILQAYKLKPDYIQTDNMYGAIICQPYYVP